MTRYALMLCAGLFAAVVAACVQGHEPPPLHAALHHLNTCTTLPIRGVVSASFDPATQTGAPTISTDQVPANIVADIYTAFSAAPDSFKNQLCALAGIYITPAPHSWGYRDINVPTNRYIALSANLWPAPGYGAIRLSDYERATIAGLLPTLGNDPTPVYYQQATYNPPLPWASDGPITVLAALAHEFGHLLWLELFVPSPGQNPDFSHFCSAVFPQNSWQARPDALRWQRFGVVNDYPRVIPDDSSSMPISTDPPPADAKVQKLIDQARLASSTGQRQDYDKARRIMARILAKVRPWPSLFGGYSVNEQFVETFTLYTLLRANPGLTSLALSIPSGNPNVQDIPGTLRDRRRLLEMLDCFVPYGGPYPVP
jgi:hypothetical protein